MNSLAKRFCAAVLSLMFIGISILPLSGFILAEREVREISDERQMEMDYLFETRYSNVNRTIRLELFPETRFGRVLITIGSLKMLPEG